MYNVHDNLAMKYCTLRQSDEPVLRSARECDRRAFRPIRKKLDPENINCELYYLLRSTDDLRLLCLLCLLRPFHLFLDRAEGSMIAFPCATYDRLV